MVLLMNRPMKRSGSSLQYFRKRVPTDILAIARGKRGTVVLPAGRSGEPSEVAGFTIGADIRISLRTNDAALAKQRNAAVTGQLEALFSELRLGPPPAVRIPHKQIVALAGEVYALFARGLEDEPVLSAEEWSAVAASQRDDVSGPLPPPLGIYTSESERRAAEISQRDRLFDGRYGRIADAILAKHRVTLIAEQRVALLRAVAQAAPEASAKLARNANHDYSPDQFAVRFPAVELNAPAKPVDALPFAELQRRWEAEGPKARRTRSANRSVVGAFTEHLGHADAARVSRADVLAWKDALQASGLKPKSINDGYLSHIRILFRVAKRNDLLASDPTEGIRVPIKAKAGTSRLPYTDTEVAKLLALADKESVPRLRWMPWLLALTGARAGEIAQLWGAHVKERSGMHFISITPTEDGGEIKNAKSERDVPLHPAIIDRGFLAFVASRRGGPLFYGGESASPRPPKPNASSHAAKGAITRISAWVRKQPGFDDPRKAPSHALRHWFKSACLRAGVLDSVADAIQGHVGSGGEASTYRHVDLPTMYAAICRLPVSESIR